jgi:hypothetical protein
MCHETERGWNITPSFIQTFPFSQQASNSLLGIVSYISIVFAILSDTIPDEFRAQGYGIVLSAFCGGLALGPSIPLLWSPNTVALISLILMVASFLVAACTLPETLAQDVRHENERIHSFLRIADADSPDVSLDQSICNAILRPVREVAILNRNWPIRLVAVCAFLSSMVSSSDGTLVIYYLEEQLNVRIEDFASMFFVLGVVGVVVQGGMIQPMIRLLGEKTLLVTTFACGTLHNMLYAVARCKGTIYLALIVAQWSRLNVPLLSSLASKDVTKNEQGRIQGALFATNAVANAAGPLSMEFIYGRTKNNPHLGPGFMFVFASGLYFLGTLLVLLIPVSVPLSAVSEVDAGEETLSFDQSDLREPLLESNDHSDHEAALVDSD